MSDPARVAPRSVSADAFELSPVPLHVDLAFFHLLVLIIDMHPLMVVLSLFHLMHMFRDIFHSNRFVSIEKWSLQYP